MKNFGQPVVGGPVEESQMLISFAVENYRSYRERQEVSLLAGVGNELYESTVAVSGVTALRGKRLLKALAVYGANASGKSNLIRAFDTFRDIIILSAKESVAKDELPVSAFALDQKSRSAPTSFTARFVVESVLYEYSIAVTRHRVESEVLIAYPRKLPQRLFQRFRGGAGRSEWQFSRTHFRRDKELERRTRENSLYVSVGAQFNHELLSKIQAFFGDADVREPRLADLEHAITAENCLKNGPFRQWAAKVLHDADTGIDGLSAKRVDITERIPEEIRQQFPKGALRDMRRQIAIETAHRIPGTGRVAHWSFSRESDGTRQLLSLLRSWYTTIRNGGLVMVDELDDSLHPLLSRRLLQMINDRALNPRGGQLLFTTHDTTLLDPTLLRRDQIYFAERTASGATRLYSLLDYAPRKDEALQRGYLGGRYGAIPFLREFSLEPSTRK